MGRWADVADAEAVGLIPVAGCFMTGTSADIPLSLTATAFIEEDVSVAVVPVSAPMVVTAPAKY